MRWMAVARDMFYLFTILSLLGGGLVITILSGMPEEGRGQFGRRLWGNLYNAALVVSGTLVGLVVLHQFLGLPSVTGW